MIDEDLKALFAEVGAKIKEVSETQQRLAIQMAEQTAKTEAQIAETDAKLSAQIAETDAKLSAQIAETDARLAAQLAEIEKQRAATDAKLAAQLAETKKQLALTSKEVGNIGRGRGEIAEEFFYRSLSADPQVGGIRFDQVYRHWAHGVGNLSDEYDVILVNGDQLLLVEVKARASLSDLLTLIHRKIPNFRVLFPNYKDYKVLGAIASLTAPEELVAKARELGVFFLTRQAKHLALVNEQARAF